tara:strand:- start:316 stop:474 length:159 start_codon:yes stop_codon:yes gene_type:complete
MKNNNKKLKNKNIFEFLLKEKNPFNVLLKIFCKIKLLKFDLELNHNTIFQDK